MSLPPAVLKSQYGQWQVIGDQFRTPKGAKVLCRCTCGKEREVWVGNLTRGGSNGCGCEKRRTITHGETGTKLYIVWTGMKARCYDPNQPIYHHYGGRGITVCEAWKHSYETFRDWARENGWQEGLQLDRIDNDGGYAPTNCRFVTREVNARNRRVTVKLTAWGETKPLPEWAEDPRCAIGITLLYCRVERGWGHERALSQAPHWRGQKGMRQNP